MMNDALKSKEEKKREAEKEQEEMKRQKQKLHKGEEEILDENELEDLRVTKKKLPPYF